MKQKYETAEKLEEALWKHFGEWGEIENINVIHRLSIAFVRFRLRTSAGSCSCCNIVCDIHATASADVTFLTHSLCSV